jgi:hypothetical protein
MKLKQPLTVRFGWLSKQVIIPAGSICVPASNLPDGSGWWLKSTPRRASLANADGFDKSNQSILKSFEFKSWKRIYGVRIRKEMLS